jgi:protein phosphatase
VLRAYGLTDKGHVRPTNEDCFGIDDSLGLCIVADGMGGHNAGEVAARIAVDTVVDYMRTAASSRAGAYGPFGVNSALTHDGNLLRTAVHLANTQVLEASVIARECSGMGTTIVAAFVRGERLSVAHVGDSRLYVFSERRLRQVTDDDSWTAGMLARDPRTDLAALQNHPLRHALTNVVGAQPYTDVHVADETLREGDLLVLTTDGVHGPLDERRIAELVEGEDIAGMAASLVAAALSSGGRDNCTAIVAQYLPD